MRLIDRDLLLSEIEKSRGKNPHKDYKIRANHTIEHDHIAHLVLEQPVAYNVDKVVERLEEEARCNQSEANELAQHGDYGTATMLQGIAKGYKYSADIIKSGGIE